MRAKKSGVSTEVSRQKKMAEGRRALKVAAQETVALAKEVSTKLRLDEPQSVSDYNAQIDDAVLICANSGIIKGCNAVAANLFGDILQTDVRLLFRPAEGVDMTNIWTLLENKTTWQQNPPAVVVCKDGTTFLTDPKIEYLGCIDHNISYLVVLRDARRLSHLCPFRDDVQCFLKKPNSKGCTAMNEDSIRFYDDDPSIT